MRRISHGRHWVREGSQRSAPHKQRTASAYIFGAICPEASKGAAAVSPVCHTAAMNVHLAEIASQGDADAHAALLPDQVGGHPATTLQVPLNITLLPRPATCPELNPQENVWQFLRHNWLSNMIFTPYDGIVDRCCNAWNRLIDQPWCIMSLGLGDWGPQVLSRAAWY